MKVGVIGSGGIGGTVGTLTQAASNCQDIDHQLKLNL
jgi:malate/lactate dehydrogenase